MNHKVDGLEYFVENLVDTNGGAAATLISKMIAPEQPSTPEWSGLPAIINISTIAEGQQFLPGGEVLMPFEEAREVWRAFNAGPEAWNACLQTIESKLTLKAFESLCRVPPLERKALALSETPLLSLVPDDGGDPVGWSLKLRSHLRLHLRQL